eukprot:9483905-Pyramimonas_sp.AAC.1
MASPNPGRLNPNSYANGNANSNPDGNPNGHIITGDIIGGQSQVVIRANIRVQIPPPRRHTSEH